MTEGRKKGMGMNGKLDEISVAIGGLQAAVSQNTETTNRTYAEVGQIHEKLRDGNERFVHIETRVGSTEATLNSIVPVVRKLQDASIRNLAIVGTISTLGGIAGSTIFFIIKALPLFV